MAFDKVKYTCQNGTFHKVDRPISRARRGRSNTRLHRSGPSTLVRRVIAGCSGRVQTHYAGWWGSCPSSTHIVPLEVPQDLTRRTCSNRLAMASRTPATGRGCAWTSVVRGVDGGNNCLRNLDLQRYGERNFTKSDCVVRCSNVVLVVHQNSKTDSSLVT